MSLSKKIFITSGSVFLMLIFFWGIYKVAFTPKPTVAPPPMQVEQEKLAVNPPAKKRLSAVSTEAIIAPTISNNNLSVKYYAKNNGRIFQIDTDGENKLPLSTQNLDGLTNSFWSPDKSKVVSSFSLGGRTTYSYYNFITKAFAPLNSNIVNVAWKNDNRIIYFYLDKANSIRDIGTANPDGTDWKKVADVPFDNVFIAPVQATGSIAYWNIPDSNTTSTLSLSSPIEGTPTQTIFSGKFGADYLWSPDGNRILVSHSDQQGGSKVQLALLNSQGGDYSLLNIPTIVSKVTWSPDSNTFFYALPSQIPDTIVMPNDYFAKKFTSVDTFWSYNILTDKKTRLLELNELTDLPTVDAINLFLDANGNNLFFTNRIDGKLYRLEL